MSRPPRRRDPFAESAPDVPLPKLIEIPPRQLPPLGHIVMVCCDGCHARKVHLYNPQAIKWHRDPILPNPGKAAHHPVKHTLTIVHRYNHVTVCDMWWAHAG